MLSCEKCAKMFSNIHIYFAHIRNVHRFDPDFKFVCGVNSCPVTLNFSSLKNHLNKHETFKAKKTSNRLTCKVCNFKTYLKSKFIAHFKSHDQIVCPVKNCESTYSVYSSFTSHLSRFHPCCVLEDFKSEILDKISHLPHSDVQNFDSCFDYSKEESKDISLSEYNRSVVLFILKMQEECLLPDSTIKELINGITGLQHEAISLFQRSLSETTKNITISDTVINHSTDQLREIFNIMKSQHLKAKFLREHLKLVEPVQYELKLGSEISNYQYVPILKNIQVLCENPEVLDYIMSNPVNENLNILSDIHDGAKFKNNPIFQNVPCIKIILYFDEFMAFNPLRGNQTKHKLAAFYYTLGNIPYQYRSETKNMQLALMCWATDLKKFGFNAVLEPLIKDLKILEDEGIIISGVPCKVKGGIVAIVGDNLAAHQIGGYVICFSGNIRCCRFCLATNEDMQTIFTDSTFTSRSKELHKVHLSLIAIDSKYSSIYGLKYQSSFNSLRYFHTSTMLPPDAMHDLLEGIVPIELGLILDVLIQKRYVTLSQLNNTIKKSKYGLYDSANKPIEISQAYSKGIKMIASRVCGLLRFLPLFIGEYIPETEPVWLLLLMLREIVDIILAPKINVSYVSYLADIIKDHHSLLKELFPNFIFKPKFHYLVHYPKLILEFGPLVSFWSMRFEAKHLYFKRVSQSIKNNINLPYSLSRRHQNLQCYYNFDSLRTVGKSDKITCAKPINVESYPLEIAVLLKDYNDFYVVTNVEINGLVYKPGMCLISSFANDEPAFSKIIMILRKETVTKFLCRNFASSTLFHIKAFKFDDSIGVRIFYVHDFIDPYPLSLYKYKKQFVVILKYLVINPSEYA